MDYHLAEVIRRGHHYQAHCKCGWRGHVRETKEAAEQDATAHDVTHNPIKPGDR